MISLTDRTKAKMIENRQLITCVDTQDIVAFYSPPRPGVFGDSPVSLTIDRLNATIRSGYGAFTFALSRKNLTEAFECPSYSFWSDHLQSAPRDFSTSPVDQERLVRWVALRHPLADVTTEMITELYTIDDAVAFIETLTSDKDAAIRLADQFAVSFDYTIHYLMWILGRYAASRPSALMPLPVAV